MIPFAQEMVSHWPYVVGSLSFAASVLACILGLQRVMKTREEIHKLKLETEAKEDERRARINEEKSEQSGVIFESIAINRGNDEWKEVELADLHIEPKHRLEKAASFLQNVDLSNIRYFQINGFFYLSIPSFDIIIANRSKKGVLVTEVGVRAIYVADSDMDMPGGGGEESSVRNLYFGRIKNI